MIQGVLRRVTRVTSTVGKCGLIVYLSIFEEVGVGDS
jgi:hypothetical protein